MCVTMVSIQSWEENEQRKTNLGILIRQDFFPYNTVNIGSSETFQLMTVCVYIYFFF